MRDKKKTRPEKTSEQEALEKRVDAMMDPKKPDETIPETKPPAKAGTVPPADVQSVTTAPQLSSKLRKKITVSGVPTEPLSIDKLDELTESIAASESEDKPKTKPAPKKVAPKPEADEQEPEKTDEPLAGNDPTDKSTDLDDAQTDKAVEDIVAYESDVMLAVADSTAEAHSRELAVPEHKPHRMFSTFMWTIVALVVVLAIGLCILLVMGDSLSSKLGL